MADSRCWTRDIRRLTKGVVLGLLGCHGATAFMPSGVDMSAIHRDTRCGGGSSCRVHTRVTTASSSSSSSDSNHSRDHSTQTTKSTAAFSWTAASRTAAACLATAAILSASLPAGAGDQFDSSSGLLLRGMGTAPARTTMLLADEGISTSADGRADVSQLVSELKKADRADLVLNAMVKINDVVDADEDGVLENPVAAESIVKGLIDKRRSAGEAWDSNTETAFGILKRKLDPFNVVLLRPYLKIAPFLGGAYYLAVFFVQQKFRDFFPYAYFGAVAVFVAPALIIVLTS